MNNFPPLFPQSKFLNKKLWHKLIFIFSFVYSSCSAYSFFLAFIVLLDSLGILSVGISKTLTLPMTLPLFSLMFFSKPTPHPGTNISYPIFQDPGWGLIILMVYFFISIFLPGLIYRIFLKAILGNKWKH